KDFPGLVKIVVRQNFVGVVAEKPWQAMQAAARLKTSWGPGSGLPHHAKFHEYLRNHPETRDTLVVNSNDIDGKMAGATTVVKATYQYPYQMHASVGSACAVADVQPDKA